MPDLNRKQRLILKFLDDKPGWTMRREMQVAAGKKGFSAALGAYTKGRLDPSSLEALRYVERRDTPKRLKPSAYRITELGKRALFLYESKYGRVVLRDIVLAAEDADENIVTETYHPQDGDQRPLVERLIRQRRGQKKFRDSLRKRYKDRCVVTGCEVLDLLEAAHIKPYRGEDDNHSENGLLLRADIHTLFDLDLLGIEPKELRVELHPAVANDNDYNRLHGRKLDCLSEKAPSRKILNLRYQQFQARLKIRHRSRSLLLSRQTE